MVFTTRRAVEGMTVVRMLSLANSIPRPVTTRTSLHICDTYRRNDTVS